MGCLHEGHLSLVREARKYADIVIATIFVNPMQFGPTEDFSSYPRQLAADCQLLEAERVDLLFCPAPEEMYPEGFQTSIRVKELAKPMCGASRPGHFDGVATVLTKLFHLTYPDYAFFGEKDFQQLTIIKRLVKDLNFDIEVVGCPIIREKDGLALSSRNKYLTPETRTQALCLFKSIQAAQDMVRQHGSGLLTSEILNKVKEIISAEGGRLDYAVIVNEDTLNDVQEVGKGSVIALAVHIADKVRLIDNAKLI